MQPRLEYKCGIGRFVEYLRKRLIILGDLYADNKDRGNFFDESIEEAVLRYQKRHGWMKPAD